MSTYNLLTDEQIEASLCGQLEAERLRRNVTQAELARQAGVSVRTIRRMEKGEGVSLATFIRTMKALNLEDRLETLFPDQSIQPIERVRKTMQVRERASGTRKSGKPTGDWHWGDE